MNKELLSFKRKTIGILLVQSVVICIGVIAIISLVMFPNIRTLENRYVDENLARVENSFMSEIEFLEQITFDWAVWDDTYYFIQNKNEAYINSNIDYSTLENLRLDIMIYIDDLDQIVYGVKADDINEELVMIDNLSEECKSLLVILKNNKNGESKVGLVNIDGKPFIIVAHPVFLGDKSSKSNGMFIIGTWMDENFIGKNLSDIMPSHIAEEGLVKLREALANNTVTIQEYELDIEGAITYFEVRFISKSKEEVFAILRDVTELNENKRYIEYLSYHDQLTKINNRRYYEEQIVQLDSKENLPMTLAMIDVNGLKLINDIFGHSKGDILIINIANILKANCGDRDLLARIGGDEFVMVFPNTTFDEAEAKIEAIQENVSQCSIENITMSISIGTDTKVVMNEGIDELLVSAENKMYRKKLVESQLMRKNTVKGILNNIYDNRHLDKEHSLNVKDLCLLLGKALNYDVEESEELVKSAILHDIGKVSVDDVLLDMPRILEHDEFEEIKKHAENGYQLLKSVDSYANIAENVLSHHEYWDGNGYPRNIKGDKIPEISRIIAIADAYDSMTSFRPYKETLTKDEAILELKRCSGTQFDPRLVDVFIHQCI